MPALRGLAFPFTVVGGRVKMANYDPTVENTELIEQTIKLSLMTSVTERWGNITAGGNARAIVFDNFTPAWEETIRQFLIAGIVKELPQVLIQDVRFKRQNDKVYINLHYQVQGSDQSYEISFTNEESEL